MRTIISIIIPVYNVEPYILDCLRSVAGQSITEGVECILVDDCGTDKSVDVAEKFIQRYQGNIIFHICHHKENKGLSAARNTGIMAATGEYVYFLDSDDTITPGCMAGFTKIIEEHSGVDLIQGLIDQDTAYMNQFSNKGFPAYTEDRKYIKRALLDFDELPVCAANKMVRRQLIIDNDLYFKEGIIHEDNYWSFFLAKHIRSLAVYQKKCYLYTVNPGSITKAVNVEKEIYSYRIMIEDCCNNIDGFMRGEQKRYIILMLKNALGNYYYKTEKDRKFLVNCLSNQCNFIEKVLLHVLLYRLSSNDKTFVLLLKLFRLY